MTIPTVDHRFVKDPHGRDSCDFKIDDGGRTNLCGRPLRAHFLNLADLDKFRVSDSELVKELSKQMAGFVPGFKHDNGKPRWDLLPWHQVRSVVQVLTWALQPPNSYPENNWQQIDNPRGRYFSAAVRHLFAWWEGKRTDEKSALPHLAHAICSILFLMWFDDKAEER